MEIMTCIRNTAALSLLQIPDYRNAVIVARNPNSVKRASSYAERLRLGIAVIHGEEKIETEFCDGRNSPPPLDEDQEHQRNHEFGIETLPSKFIVIKPAISPV